MPERGRSTKRTVQVVERSVLEELIFRTSPLRRFTQDSPILPDVWFEYGRVPDGRADLLLTPARDASPGGIFKAIRARLSDAPASDRTEREEEDPPDPELAYSQSTVAVKLWFDQFVRVVIPMAVWQGEPERDTVRAWVELGSGKPDVDRLARKLVDLGQGKSVGDDTNLLWMARIVGTIELARHGRASEALLQVGPLAERDANLLVRAVAGLMAGVPSDAAVAPTIFSVSMNRPAVTTVWRSMQAVKADAARRLFELSCSDLQWVVMDSGIDARHPAFRTRDKKGALMDVYSDRAGQNVINTRVVATYDFTRIRTMLNPDRIENAAEAAVLSKALEATGDTVQDLKTHLASGRRIDWDLLAPLLEVPHTQEEYKKPKHEHGTHVAGILAGNWRADDDGVQIVEFARGDEVGKILGRRLVPPANDLVGMCPDLKLYDIRVLGADGGGEEFSIIAALQFVRHLNANKDHVVVHGVNLSLSIPHDVANYACGRTPVCEECERLTGTGVVVVASAGNEGYAKFATAAGYSEGYRNISITDPGNAQDVITVGATHRYRPHTYGVSYFSSRGPTGDGRSKPDLVAPGEKIWSAVPDNNVRTLDGTSMATPHVSGSAALLMARHRELVGQPERVKEILSRTSTDLGRERYFQGSGMVDVLRAIQSV